MSTPTESELNFYYWKNAGLDVPWRPLIILNINLYGKIENQILSRRFNFYRWMKKEECWDFVTQRNNSILIAVTPEQFKTWKTYKWTVEEKTNHDVSGVGKFLYE